MCCQNLKKQNSWFLTSDGKIKFSQGDQEFSGKIYDTYYFEYYESF